MRAVPARMMAFHRPRAGHSAAVTGALRVRRFKRPVMQPCRPHCVSSQTRCHAPWTRHLCDQPIPISITSFSAPKSRAARDLRQAVCSPTGQARVCL